MAHLPKLQRWFKDSPIFFITTCTANRRPMLNRPYVHESFKMFALNAPEHGVLVGRYVLMPDHMHLFAQFERESISLGMWIKSLKNAQSKVLKTANIAPPHWDRGYFDHLIRSRESYEEKWRYVRENPVRAGLVRRAEEWPYMGEISELWFD
jgi:putative transposase